MLSFGSENHAIPNDLVPLTFGAPHRVPVRAVLCGMAQEGGVSRSPHAIPCIDSLKE